jgi:hypothetical protein
MTDQRKKHPLYDIIVAWAAGETIQCREQGAHLEQPGVWRDSRPNHITTPGFGMPSGVEWRVKPKQKVEEVQLGLNEHGTLYFCHKPVTSYPNLRITFENGKPVSAEVL